MLVMLMLMLLTLMLLVLVHALVHALVLVLALMLIVLMIALLVLILLVHAPTDCHALLLDALARRAARAAAAAHRRCVARHADPAPAVERRTVLLRGFRVARMVEGVRTARGLDNIPKAARLPVVRAAEE